jgi:tRNA A-37 threonylcarbamoyl transferase component Bud32
MNELIIGKKINEGNYTVLHKCNFKGEQCVVKITKNTTHYVSLKYQFDAMHCLQGIPSPAFRIPKVYDYHIFENIEKEALIMENINTLLPLRFVLQNVLYDKNEIIEKIAYAISALHDNGISGYDTEFFWSMAEEKIIVIDLGPRYTINCNTIQMLEQHINLMREIPWGLYNIVGDIVPDEILKTMLRSNARISMNKIPGLELLQYLSSDNISKHITNVAKMHYVQIMGCFPPNEREKMLPLFINAYTQRAHYNQLYLESFVEGYSYNICKHNAFLYYPIAKTASRMGCSIENDTRQNYIEGR